MSNRHLAYILPIVATTEQNLSR